MWPFKPKPKLLTDTERNIIKYLETHGTKLGSQVWGGATAKSDIDYVFSYDDIINLKNQLKKLDIKYKLKNGLYFTGVINNDALLQFTLGDKIKRDIVIFEDPKTLKAVKFAIKLTSHYAKLYDISNKKQRITVFEHFLTFAKEPQPIFDAQINNFLKQYYPEYYI